MIALYLMLRRILCSFATGIHRSRGMLQCEARCRFWTWVDDLWLRFSHGFIFLFFLWLSLSRTLCCSALRHWWSLDTVLLHKSFKIRHLEDLCFWCFPNCYPEHVVVAVTWCHNGSNFPTVSMTGIYIYIYITCVVCSRNTTCEYHWISAVCGI